MCPSAPAPLLNQAGCPPHFLKEQDPSTAACGTPGQTLVYSRRFVLHKDELRPIGLHCHAGGGGRVFAPFNSAEEQQDLDLVLHQPGFTLSC